MRVVLFGVLIFAACTPTTAPDAGSSNVSVNTNNNPNLVTVDAGEREPTSPVASGSALPSPSEPTGPEPTYDEYKNDPKAKALAQELWTKWKIDPGLEKPYTMDGGYRGMIKIEPAAPVNADRQHLEWVVAAFRDFDQFFGELARYAKDAGVTSTAKFYRWRPIHLRFFHSVAARTPSAYADGWMVAYNLVGSLNKSADAVRETMFHELFHSNDYSRPSSGEKPWCDGPLRAPFDAVWKKCNTAIPCLTPYTPTDTIVRNGTYYAFQPGNGLPGVEYAAELATRYYREQRAIFRGLPRVKPFKCGPPENGRAWKAIGDEWFGGIDAVPACP